MFERECTVEGRRIPLRTIRSKTLERFVKAGITRSKDQNITRHLMVWADHASVLNTGHILLTVKTLYTPHLFLTDSEVLQQTGEKMSLVFLYFVIKHSIVIKHDGKFDHAFYKYSLFNEALL